MDPLTAAASSGMRARMEALDLLANNLANAGTTGYKADRESYQQYVGDQQVVDAWSDVAANYALPVIERQWTDQAQGTLTSTNRSLDVALQGEGYFRVAAGKQALLTRNGNFHVSPQGNLQTSEGYLVQKRGGGTFQLNDTEAVTISPAGEVIQGGKTQGYLDIVQAKDPRVLSKERGTAFYSVDQPGQLLSIDTRVAQGKLETSNTNPAESAVKMIEVLREFEMLQRAVTMGADMNKRAVEEVARVVS